ncbi:MAG: hypothetical protein H6600_10010, partial [Flavobacteriales bacterium]|nr:hypothetical protein [Flavobacteriales bacterium]
LKQRTTSFVPGVGLGLNRLIYAIVDFYPGRLYSSNRIGGHLVIRIPLFSSQDYQSGIPPGPYE